MNAAKLFGEYLGSTTAAYKEADLLQEACNKLNSSNDAEKILCAQIDVNVDGEPQRAKYRLDYLEDLRLNNPDIKYMYETNYMINQDVHKDFLFRVENLGYERNFHSDYNRKTGTVVIEKGKADKNILVVAKASKAELLHIGGYLATTQTIQKYASKDKIKGVSLAYNKMNISRSTSPKNVAIALFTINDEVGSTASDEFCFMVKNAENVYVYTKTTPGGGTASAKTTYNQKADNKVENLYAPEESVKSSKSAISYNFDKRESPFTYGKNEKTISGSGFLGIIKKVITSVLALIWILVRLALLAFAILMIFNKKFRGNFFAWLFNTKHGPKFQSVYEKIVNFISSLFVAGKKLKGNASLQGKFAFISHASVDLKKQGSPVAALIAELESIGVPCWTSEKGIGVGEDYNEILPVAIKKCEIMLFFISPVSISSEEVESEIIAAKREKKKLIPIQISDFDLFANEKWQHLLSQYQVAPLFTANPEDVKKMAEKIKTVFES